MDLTAELFVLESALTLASQVCPGGLASYRHEEKPLIIIKDAVDGIKQGLETDNSEEERQNWDMKLALLFLIKYMKGKVKPQTKKEGVKKTEQPHSDETDMDTESYQNIGAVAMEGQDEEDVFDVLVASWPQVNLTLLCDLISHFDWMNEISKIIAFWPGNASRMLLMDILNYTNKTSTGLSEKLLCDTVQYITCQQNTALLLHTATDQHDGQNSTKKLTVLETVTSWVSHRVTENDSDCSCDDLLTRMTDIVKEKISSVTTQWQSSCLLCFLNITNAAILKTLPVQPVSCLNSQSVQSAVKKLTERYSIPQSMCQFFLQQNYYTNNKSVGYLSSPISSTTIVNLLKLCKTLCSSDVLEHIEQLYTAEQRSVSDLLIQHKLTWSEYFLWSTVLGDFIRSAIQIRDNTRTGEEQVTAHKSVFGDLNPIVQRIQALQTSQGDAGLFQKAAVTVVTRQPGFQDQFQWLLKLMFKMPGAQNDKWLDIMEDNADLVNSSATCQLLLKILDRLRSCRDKVEATKRIEKVLHKAVLVLDPVQQNQVIKTVLKEHYQEALFAKDPQLEADLLAALNQLVSSNVSKCLPVIVQSALRRTKPVLKLLISEAVRNSGKITAISQVLQALPSMCTSKSDSGGVAISLLVGALLDLLSERLLSDTEFENLLKLLSALFQITVTQDPTSKKLQTTEDLLNKEEFIHHCVAPFLGYQLTEDLHFISPIRAVEMLGTVLQSCSEQDRTSQLTSSTATVLLYCLCSTIDKTVALWDGPQQLLDLSERVVLKEKSLSSLKVLEEIILEKNIDIKDEWLLTQMEDFYWTTQYYLWPVLSVQSKNELVKGAPGGAQHMLMKSKQSETTPELNDYADALLLIELARVPWLYQQLVPDDVSASALPQPNTYLNLVLSLSQVLPHCTTAEWVQVWSVVDGLVDKSLVSVVHTGANLNQGGQLIFELMQQLLRLWHSGLHTEFPAESVWHHIAKGWISVCKEKLLGEEQLQSMDSMTALQELCQSFISLIDTCQQFPVLATEQVFMLSLEVLNKYSDYITAIGDDTVAVDTLIAQRTAIKDAIELWPRAHEQSTFMQKLELFTS